MFLQKKALTLIELVVATLISSMILLFLMNFLAGIFNDIGYANKKADAIKKIYSIENNFKNIEEQYSSGNILIDNNSSSGSDVLIFKNNANNGGYVVGIVNKNNLKLDPKNNVDIIQKKYIGFRKISNQELSELNSNPDKVYDYKFNLDELIPDLVFKNLQVEKYNSGNILEIEMKLNIDYNENNYNEKYSNHPEIKIEKFILDI